MEMLPLIKKIIILTAAPILITLVLAVALKLWYHLVQKLSDKTFQIVDRHQPKPIGRYGRLAFGSFKIWIGFMLFTIFIDMFVLPVYFIPALNWEPPVIIVILLVVIAMLFSGLITYKLMQIVNKSFNPPGNQQHND